jgi:hypothetical protein
MAGIFESIGNFFASEPETKVPQWEYTSKAGDNPMERQQQLMDYTGLSWEEIMASAKAYGNGAVNSLDYIMSTPGSLGTIDNELNRGGTGGKFKPDIGEEGNYRQNGVIDLYRNGRPGQALNHELGHMNSFLQMPARDKPGYAGRVRQFNEETEKHSRFNDFVDSGLNTFGWGGDKDAAPLENIGPAYAAGNKVERENFDLGPYSREEQESLKSYKLYREYLDKKTPTAMSDILSGTTNNN